MKCLWRWLKWKHLCRPAGAEGLPPLAFARRGVFWPGPSQSVYTRRRRFLLSAHASHQLAPSTPCAGALRMHARSAPQVELQGFSREAACRSSEGEAQSLYPLRTAILLHLVPGVAIYYKPPALGEQRFGGDSTNVVISFNHKLKLGVGLTREKQCYAKTQLH